MNDLQSLVYVSTASHHLSDAEISHLLGRARARNAHELVTGVLLYSHGNFMQYLEGPRAGMESRLRAHRGRPAAQRRHRVGAQADPGARVFGLDDGLSLDKRLRHVESAQVRRPVHCQDRPGSRRPLGDAQLAVEVLEQRASADAVQRDLVAQRLRQQPTGGRRRLDRAASSFCIDGCGREVRPGAYWHRNLCSRLAASRWRRQ